MTNNKVEATYHPQTHPVRQEVTPGTPVVCPLWCQDNTWCLGCGEPCCPMHSPEFSLSECVEGGFHHQDDCEDTCPACDAQAREDYLIDRADAIRKGDDDY